MNFKRIRAVGFLAAILPTFAAIADNDKTMVVEGVPVTGLNRLLGLPLWDFGSPEGTIGFSLLAAFNPDGEEPLPLTQDSPGSTILATTADPVFLSIFGLTEDDFDPTDVNLPLRDVKANVDLTGEGRMSLRSLYEADQLEPSRAVPSAPIDLHTWLKARGNGIIRCTDEGENSLKLQLHDLIPHGLYTVIGVFAPGNGAVRPGPPIGGVPNVLVANSKGQAVFRREINFCPMDIKEGEEDLLFIAIIYHSDQHVYGNVPVLLQKGILPGLQGHAHVGFLVRGESVQ